MIRLCWFAVLLFVPLCALNAGDLKIITIRHYSRMLQNRTDPNIFPDQDWTRTEAIYVHGPMRRFEYRDEQPRRATSPSTGLSQAAFIENCDTRELITADLETREYTRGTYGSAESMRAAAVERLKRGKTDWSQTKMSADIKTVDTGETMSSFGYTAHHFVVTTHETPVGETTVLLGKVVDSTVDAWYIDAKFQIPERGCEPEDVVAATREVQLSESRDEKRTGPTLVGFPVKFKRISRTAMKPRSSDPTVYTETLETTVTELSEAPLERSLFTAPPEYKMVTCLRSQPCSGK